MPQSPKGLKPHWRIKVCRNISAHLWGNLLAHSASATPFSSQSWMRAWSVSFGCRPLYVIASEPDGTLLAGIPVLETPVHQGILREYQCLPWGCYGSVITRDASSPDCIAAVLARYLNLLRGSTCLGGTVVDFAGNSSMLSEVATSVSENFAHVLKLDRPMEEIYRDYDYSIKKNLKKAERNSVFVRDADAPAEIEAYCDLSDAVAKKYGRAPYSRDFFRNVYRLMTPLGHARFTLAFQHGRPIAGTLHIINGKHIFNWLTVSNPDFLDLRPVEAIIAAIIPWAVSEGCQIYNFGASPSDAEGVIHFKEKWGAERALYKTYYLNKLSTTASQISRLMTIFGRLRHWLLTQSPSAIEQPTP
jgi:CelD/BcsL family acetyltransferase involved in cellulose biosynthesis